MALGFVGFSVDELSASLGISKKTFYKLFDSKEDLVRQVAERTMAEMRAGIQNIARADTDFVTKLHSIMMFFGRAAGRFSRMSFQDLRKLSPEVWQRIREFRRQRIQDIFGRLLDQGIREGSIRPDVNRRIFLLAYLGVVESLIVPSVLAEESFSAEEAIGGIIDLMFRGVLTDDGRARLQSLQSQL
jgi:AcrR family transcriptional regulator